MIRNLPWNCEGPCWMSCWACLMALITMMLCCVKRERGAGERVIISSSSSSSSWGPCEGTIERVSGQGFWWELTSQASFLFSFSLWPFLLFFTKRGKHARYLLRRQR